MRILVTGGSGFVGKRIISKLVDDGHTVLALARSDSSADTVCALGAAPVVGDLDVPGSLKLSPLDAVVHAAAHFRFTGPRGAYFRTNVGGTRALLEAAKDTGARTFVHLSAGAVVMDDRGSPIRGADESAPTFPRSFSGYIASKACGEAAVLANNTPGFRTIALRPPAIWGPGYPFSREIPRVVASGRFAFIDRGEYPFATCHVDNVVEAVVCALERGTGGRAYFITDQELTTFRDFIGGLAKLGGLSIDGLRSVSYRPAFAVGRLMELGATLGRSEDDPPLSRTIVRMIGREFTPSDRAARTELGYVGRVLRTDGLQTYANIP
jgi:nucleoside-diphosphate-sugar epimerase